MQEVPIYVFVGFLESGKTRFICETLGDSNFTEDENTLYVLTEEGMEEPDKELMRKTRTTVVTIAKPEDLNPAALRALAQTHDSDRVMIEYNGMWQISNLQTMLPEDWPVYQIVALVDGASFELYAANMGALMMEHIANADMVVINRANEATREKLRARNLRAMNPRANIFFEDEEGNPEDYLPEGELPFDIDAPVIELSDLDYGLWYIDAMNAPDKYVGKTVKFTGMVYKSPDFAEDVFVPGRFGMVCCADDITFVGFMCHSAQAVQLTKEDWVSVTATIQKEFYPQFRGDGPVLYATLIEPAEKPDPELAYFNS